MELLTQNPEAALRRGENRVRSRRRRAGRLDDRTFEVRRVSRNHHNADPDAQKRGLGRTLRISGDNWNVENPKIALRRSVLIAGSAKGGSKGTPTVLFLAKPKVGKGVGGLFGRDTTGGLKKVEEAMALDKFLLAKLKIGRGVG